MFYFVGFVIKMWSYLYSHQLHQEGCVRLVSAYNSRPSDTRYFSSLEFYLWRLHRRWRSRARQQGDHWARWAVEHLFSIQSWCVHRRGSAPSSFCSGLVSNVSSCVFDFSISRDHQNWQPASTIYGSIRGSSRVFWVIFTKFVLFFIRTVL